MHAFKGLLVGFVFAGAGWGQHPTLQSAPPASSSAAPAKATAPVVASAVTLPVVVLQKSGELAGGLAKADFTLQVDGHPQPFEAVEAGAELPLTLGLLVDTSPGQRGETDEERKASGAFFEQMLSGAKDQGFVLQFAHEIELLQDPTGSKPKLQAALRELGTASPTGAAQTVSVDDDASDRRGSKTRLGTVMFDAVFLASDEVMAKQKGRKALVLLTDGNDRDSKERVTTAIEAAERSDTVVYAVYLKGEAPPRDNTRDANGYPGGGNGGGYPGGGYPGGGYPGGGYPGGGYPGGGYPGGGGPYPRGGQNPQPQAPSRNDGRKVLERITRETGGRLFEVSKKETLAEIYAEIGKELRGQYRLTFTPETGNAGAGFHKVELTLSGADKKKWTVQTRDGYYVGR